MELKAILKAIQSVVERDNFKSRKIWLTIPDEKYPQVIEVECQQAKIDLFDGVSIGAPVIAHCNLRGREWTDPQGVIKVFNSIVCWRVEADKAAQVAPGPGNMDRPAADVPDLIDDKGDRLPF